MFLDCEPKLRVFNLANIFENHKSLDENSPMRLSDLLGPLLEAAVPALPPVVQVYKIIHDIVAQDAQMVLKKYIKTTTAKRCKKHMVETDEFVSSITAVVYSTELCIRLTVFLAAWPPSSPKPHVNELLILDTGYWI